MPGLLWSPRAEALLMRFFSSKRWRNLMSCPGLRSLFATGVWEVGASDCDGPSWKASAPTGALLCEFLLPKASNLLDWYLNALLEVPPLLGAMLNLSFSDLLNSWPLS